MPFNFSIEESEKYIGKSPKIQSDQYITTKLTKLRDHTLNENLHSNLKEYEDISSHDLLRHHEDSGIDMSPIKKDDNLEGEEFLERARKVSLASQYFFYDRQRKFVNCSRKCSCDY